METTDAVGQAKPESGNATSFNWWIFTKSISSTGDGCIAVNFDPSVSSNEFVLISKVDIEKLQVNPEGSIRIEIEGVSSESIRIPYELLSEFKVSPSQINLMNIQQQKPEYKQLAVVNNYGEEFEIESVSSKNGYIKMTGQNEIDKGFELDLQITPPFVNESSVLSDTLYINIKDKAQLEVVCRGFYSKKKAASVKTQKKASPSPKVPPKKVITFKAEPAMLKIKNAVAGSPLTAYIKISCDGDKDFEIKSTTSKKGLVKLLTSQKGEGDIYKLKLEITPPYTEHRLKVFFDTFYVTLAGKKNENTTRLSIPCRITASRKSGI